MNIAEKLAQIAENERRVYTAGYENGKTEGVEDLDDVLDAQEQKIAELSAILDEKADGYNRGFEDGVASVPTPEGTITITRNDTFDVTQYTSAKVNVPIPEGYIQPTGTIEITANGPVDVTQYASATVNVAGSGTDESVQTGISPNYFAFGMMPYSGATVGKALNEWAYDVSEYMEMFSTFGIKLTPDLEGKQVCIMGNVSSSYTSTPQESIMFVTGYDGKGGGTCVVAYTDIEVETVATNEYLVTIPAGHNVDGVYLCCNTIGATTAPAIILGKADESNCDFWDNFQKYGTRGIYDYAFDSRTGGANWVNIFAPKYSIFPTSANYMFYYTKLSGETLKEALERRDIILNFRLCSSVNYAFFYSDVGVIPEVDLRNVSSLSSVFSQAKATEIEKVILKDDGSQTFSGTFSGCSNLQEIRFEGVIGKSGLNFQNSTKLSKASIESIINALSTTTSGLSITLSKTSKQNAFTDAEWSTLIATRSNWTISLV